MYTYIGIDPGLKGGIAVLDSEGYCTTLWDIPTEINDKGKKELDIFKLDHFIGRVKNSMIIKDQGTLIVAVEKVHSMPGEGVTSAFNFGYMLGGIHAVLKSNKLAYVNISPQKWKKYFNLSKDKKEAVRLAEKLYPETKEQLYGPRGGIKDGRAEALLIALYLYDTTDKGE